MCELVEMSFVLATRHETLLVLVPLDGKRQLDKNR